MNPFVVGQRVVCVNDVDGSFGSLLGAGHANGLRKNAIYTVSRVKGPYIHVAGIPTGGWDHIRFRAIVENKAETDISVFKKLLQHDRQSEPV